MVENNKNKLYMSDSDSDISSEDYNDISIINEPILSSQNTADCSHLIYLYSIINGTSNINEQYLYNILTNTNIKINPRGISGLNLTDENIACIKLLYIYKSIICNESDNGTQIDIDILINSFINFNNLKHSLEGCNNDLIKYLINSINYYHPEYLYYSSDYNLYDGIIL